MLELILQESVKMFKRTIVNSEKDMAVKKIAIIDI